MQRNRMNRRVCLGWWVCTILLITPISPVSAEIWVSTSEGIFLLGQNKPSIEWKLSAKDKVTCFKTQFTENHELVSAWGSGRRFLDYEGKKIAAIDLAPSNKFTSNKHLFFGDGNRIRDFVLDGDNIVAAGHDNGDIHLYSLITGKHTSLHHSPYVNSIAHSVRKGDVDHDGKTEYYITITTANVAGGLGQEGQVIRLDVDWEKLTAKKSIVLDAYEKYGSHVKEIAVFDINGDGKQELILEVAPQIEVYGRNNIVYTEPMQFLLAEYKNNHYQFSSLAESNIRLGRTLSFADIDKDGFNELFFIDYFETGIYVLESKHDPIKAEGENVNKLDNGWSLTRIAARSKDSEDLTFTTQLKGNHIIHLPEKNQLIASNDSARAFRTRSGLHVPAVPMSIHQYNIVIGQDSYYLAPGNVNRIGEVGEIWHLNARIDEGEINEEEKGEEKIN